MPAKAGGRGVWVHECARDRIDHVIRCLEYVAIPEANDPIATHFEPFGSSCIMSHLPLIRMRLSVEFDDQTCVGAKEIGNIRTDVCLAAKTES